MQFINKKLLLYSTVIFVFLLLLTTLRILVNPQYAVVLIIATSLIPLILLSVYFTNKLRFSYYQKMLADLKDKINIKQGSCLLEIQQPSFKTTFFRQSFKVDINLNPIKSTCFYATSSNFFILLYSISEFGFIQIYKTPVVFVKNENLLEENIIKKFKKIVYSFEVKTDGDDLILFIKEDKLEVNKVKLINIKEDSIFSIS